MYETQDYWRHKTYQIFSQCPPQKKGKKNYLYINYSRESCNFLFSRKDRDEISQEERESQVDVRCLRGSDKALINVTEKPPAACGSVAFLGTHPYRHERRKTTRRASSVLLGHKVETELTASALIVGRDKESARNFALELSRENSAIIARALISR